MEYKYCEKDNYEDFAGGRVLYHKAGLTNFPVRLAQEIFCRCLGYLKDKSDICLYDPCCGSGYLLTVLGFLNAGSLKTIMGSDISEEALKTASLNLSLLGDTGFSQRYQQLQSLYSEYGKESHREALESAERLLSMLVAKAHRPAFHVFHANVFSPEAFLKQNFKADIVISDVPYGDMVSWRGSEETGIAAMLNNLLPVLKPTTVIAVCSDKKQKIQAENFRRLEKQQIGKRKFEIFSLK